MNLLEKQLLSVVQKMMTHIIQTYCFLLSDSSCEIWRQFQWHGTRNLEHCDLFACAQVSGHGDCSLSYRIAMYTFHWIASLLLSAYQSSLCMCCNLLLSSLTLHCSCFVIELQFYPREATPVQGESTSLIYPKVVEIPNQSLVHQVY